MKRRMRLAAGQPPSQGVCFVGAGILIGQFDLVVNRLQLCGRLERGCQKKNRVSKKKKTLSNIYIYKLLKQKKRIIIQERKILVWSETRIMKNVAIG